MTNNKTWQTRLQEIDHPEILHSLRRIKRGFEKECLRVDRAGNLARTPHPKALGSSLMHPFITTDYSEALLEFMTAPTEDLNELWTSLTDLHHFTYQVLEEELLWASSMPCHLPKEDNIPIAQYGSSNYGLLKQVYRQGLGYRYGRTMQTIAGIHYNFSFPISFWEKYQEIIKSRLPHKSQATDLKAFISEQYLGLMRNFLRYGWLVPLLTGASPAFSAGFLENPAPYLESYQDHTYYGPYATSLRLSDLGYHNKAQSSVEVSYNSFREFLQTMHQAVHTPYPEYTKIGVKQKDGYRQLSDSILQVEDEHYAMIRPKRVSPKDERMLSSIENQGIEYVEVRTLDINPFLALGVSPETAQFLDVFLTYCLLKESPPLTQIDKACIQENYLKVTKWGRKPNLYLLMEREKPRLLKDWALEILEEMQPIAVMFDKVYDEKSFSQACQKALVNLQHPENLPSAQVLREIDETQTSYFEVIKRLSDTHEHYFKHQKMPKEKFQYYQRLAKDSLQAQAELEALDTLSFDDYLRRYLLA